MKIETKLNFNDWVYPITYGSKEITTKCPICDGIGSIKVKEQSYSCPECYGRGCQTSYSKTNWYVAKDIHGQINV